MSAGRLRLDPAADVVATARALLGARLRANGVTVRLTEVEAYGDAGEDEASHAFRGRTPRNAVMFGPAGHAYAYFVWGMHWCLNLVTGPEGTAGAVLLRAGEVVTGVSVARGRRPGVSGPDLARGPARLMVALGLDGSANATNLIDGTGPARLLAPRGPRDEALVRSGPRVGVAAGADTPWRFWLAGEPSVSAYRPHVPRARRG